MEKSFQPEEIHDRLAKKALKHFGESALGRLASVAPYDPEGHETHDFNKVCFEARPNKRTIHTVESIAYLVGKTLPQNLHDRMVRPFEERLSEIKESLGSGKLAIMTGHQTIFEPGFALFGLQLALHKGGEDYGDIAKRTHLITARALATVDIFGRWPLTSLVRQISNVYYTFPNTKNYEDIPKDFKRSNNFRMINEFISNTEGAGNLLVVSSSATTEKRDDQGINVVPRINRGTLRLLNTGWDILPVGGQFKPDFVGKKDLTIQPGPMIRAGQVTNEVLHSAMEDTIVASRNQLGTPSRYKES